MRRWVAAIGMLLAAGAAQAQAPHEHGHGTVNIAFKGNDVVIELTAPGADIVGFERPAQTPAEEAALARAIAMLKEPLTLFAFPAAARCTVSEATVQVEGLAPAPAAAPGAAAAHAEFEGAYQLRCADTSTIRTIGFPFFEKFPRSEELEVTLVTERGQTEYEITRDEPTLDRGNFFWRWLMGR